MKSLLNFIKYNNAFPITIAVVMLGAGSAFAASPQVQGAAAAAILSQDQQVISIDNSYIVNKDLSTYSPTVFIAGVTEDASNYYVTYTLTTIDLKDYAWQDVQKAETMTVSKSDLGRYRDLGVYVTEQLNQTVENELAYLKQVQTKQSRQISQAVIATTYGGLIGKFLNSSTETLPGYTPVVVPPTEQYGGIGPGKPNMDNSGGASGGSTGGSGNTSGGASGGSSGQIGLQVLGNNPSILPLHVSYIDLGAVLVDPQHTNVGVHIYMNGVEVQSATIDTSTTTSYAIEYHATDLSGNTIVARRIVLVGGASDPGGEISTAGNVTPPAPPPTDTVSSPPPDTTPPATDTSSSTSPTDTTTPPDTSGSTTPTDTTPPVDASSSTPPDTAPPTDTSGADASNTQP